MPQKGDTRERILMEAVCLFGKYGFEAVSMRQIAAAVGIKGGSVYNHFDSKEEILEQMSAYVLEEILSYSPTMEEILHMLETKSTEEVLLRFAFDYPAERMARYLNFHRVVFAEQYRNEKLRQYLLEELLDASIGTMTRTLDILADMGRIAPCDSRCIASIFIRTLTSICLITTQDYKAAERMAEDKRQLIDSLSRLVLRRDPALAESG